MTAKTKHGPRITKEIFIDSLVTEAIRVKAAAQGRDLVAIAEGIRKSAEKGNHELMAWAELRRIADAIIEADEKTGQALRDWQGR